MDSPRAHNSNIGPSVGEQRCRSRVLDHNVMQPLDQRSLDRIGSLY